MLFLTKSKGGFFMSFYRYDAYHKGRKMKGIELILFLGIIFTIVRQLIWPGSSAFGWASTICILLFVSGIQMFCMGILGQYMSKTYLEVKNRPIYIVKEDNIDK